MTVVNCQPRETRSEQCSQLCCFEPREGHRPTLMEFLSSKAVTQRLTENERWKAIGMLQTGSIQLNNVRQFNVSQSVISRLWNHHQQTRNVTDLPCSGLCSTTQRQDHQLVTNALSCLLYTSPSPRDMTISRMPSSA